GSVLINAGIGRMSALGANRTRRDGGNDVNDPEPTKTPAELARPRSVQLRSPQLERATKASSKVRAYPMLCVRLWIGHVRRRLQWYDTATKIGDLHFAGRGFI